MSTRDLDARWRETEGGDCDCGAVAVLVPPALRRAGFALPCVPNPGLVELVWRNVETMTNVVDVYVNYLRRKVDSGHDRPLIRAIRGTGCQIGANGSVLDKLVSAQVNAATGSSNYAKAPRISQPGRSHL